MRPLWATETGPVSEPGGPPKMERFFFVTLRSRAFVGAVSMEPQRAGELIDPIRIPVFREPGTYEYLRGLGAYMRDGLTRVLQTRQLNAQVIGDGPLAQVVFSTDPVFDYRSTQKGDSTKGRALMLGLFERGVFLNPMGTKLYLSLAHDDPVVDDMLDRFDDALAAI